MLVAASTALHLRFSPCPRDEARVIAVGSVAGVLGDLAAVGLGIWQFQGEGSSAGFLLVFLALWANFGATLRISLRFLWRRPALAALLGACGAPLTYWVAHRFGAIRIAEPIGQGMAWVGVQYALSIPAWLWLARRWMPNAPGGVPPSTSPRGTPTGSTPA